MNWKFFIVILFVVAGCSSETNPTPTVDTDAEETSSSSDVLDTKEVGPASFYDLLGGLADGEATQPGSFGATCKGNSDCDSGLCTKDDVGKKFCTKTCVSECPSGFDCEPGASTDTVYWCVPHCKVEKCNGTDDDCDGLIDEGPDNKTHMCEDGNLCTVESCNATGDCQHTPKTGADCFDGSVCTVNDVCVNKTCTSGQFQKCTDGDPCTSDSCNPSSGCVFTDISSGPGSCEDGNVCTEKDFCEKGACKSGALKTCNDGNDCTLDACDNKYAKSGGCFFLPVKNGEYGTCPAKGVPDGFKNVCIGGACTFKPN